MCHCLAHIYGSGPLPHLSVHQPMTGSVLALDVVVGCPQFYLLHIILQNIIICLNE